MSAATNPCRYKIEPHAAAAVEEYGDEIMSAGWNPQLAQVGDRTIPRMDRHVDITAELAHVDIDEFLQKMYTYQG